LCQQSSQFKDRGHATGVVHGPVIDAVAIHSAASAKMIEMRADDNVFLFE